VQSFIVFAVCKHICLGGREGEEVNLTSTLQDLLSLVSPFHGSHEAKELCDLLLLSKGSV